MESFFVYFLATVRYVLYAPGLQIVLARNALFALFVPVIPALMPVMGLKALHLDPSQLGLLFRSLGAGSVTGAAFIIPWLRARYSSNALIILANLLVVLVYVSMAIVRQKELFFVVAALAGVGWTLPASPIALRNRLIEHLEEAGTDCAEKDRAALLTFVVAGGGFAGVETIGSINDLLKEARHKRTSRREAGDHSSVARLDQRIDSQPTQ